MQYTNLLSGKRRDPLAYCLRGLLRLAEVPYRIVVSRRNRRFDRGHLQPIRCGVPVISIGNLTTGGTGKTPLVCFLARHLRKRQIRVAIISRGYGARAGEGNDEAMELATRLPDVPHVQDADRVEAARIAIEELESEVLLMDDGFQHRRLHRDFDLVVIDATNPFGYGHLLPRGLLREPISSLSRANAVVLSRADLMNDRERQSIRATVARHAPSAIWAEAIHAPTSLLSWPDNEQPIHCIAGKKVVLVSAIGNPQAFAATVQRCGAEVIDSRSLPDHDPYSPQTVRELTTWLQRLDDRSIEVICTHKDLVKLQTDRLGGLNLRALLIELQLTAGEHELLDRIDAAVTTHRRD
ncbi:MAG: tetraacyldisaccharide 4'-kinase [Planctomycetaceae bacterium]